MKSLKGSTTIEMAYIMPVVFLVFTAIVYVTFYYHDKNIIQGTAYETAVIVSQKERLGETADGVQYFSERLGNKLIFFDYPEVDISQNEQQVTISVCVKRGSMAIKVEQRAALIAPEKKIRDSRRLEKLIQE